MNKKFKWWAYLHKNRDIRVKRFFTMDSIEDAKTSPFVDKIMAPFHAEGRSEAFKAAEEHFRKMSNSSTVE